MICLPASYKNQTVSVFGLGISGFATVKALQRSGAIVLAWDDNESTRERVKLQLYELEQQESEKESPNCQFISPHDYNWEEIESLIISPGIATTCPAPHWVVNLALQYQRPIKSDVELFLEAIEEARAKHSEKLIPAVIGITGTNGKSTTTALIGYILDTLGINSEVGGNIGYPVLDLKPERSVYVLELSSFQIELLPTSIINSTIDISILLNLTPDHIDRHGSFENYILAKQKLLENVKKVAIICTNSKETLQVYEKIRDDSSHLNNELAIIPVSTKAMLNHGTIMLNNQIFFMDNGSNGLGSQLTRTKMKLNLGTNSENIATAFTAVASLINLAPQLFSVEQNKVKLFNQISEAVESFPGLPHRAEYLGSIENVTFVNDSKSTNSDSSEKTLLSYEKIYWILGGKPKHGGISSLTKDWASSLAKISKIFLIGESTEEFANCLETDTDLEFFTCGDLENAFQTAILEAKKETQLTGVDDEHKITILLSPACASFDQWKNFEERGDGFRRLVNDYIQKNNCNV